MASKRHIIADFNVVQIDVNQNISVKMRGRKNVQEGQEFRKRKRIPTHWDKNKRKLLKQQGKDCVTITGKQIPAKSLKEPLSSTKSVLKK